MSAVMESSKQFQDIKKWLEAHCDNTVDKVDCPACNVLDYIGTLHDRIEQATRTFNEIYAQLDEVQKTLNILQS